MTKKFALADTLPDPYFTVDAGATATLTVKIASCESRGEVRMAVEIWRDQLILARLFGKSAEIDTTESEPNSVASAETTFLGQLIVKELPPTPSDNPSPEDLERAGEQGEEANMQEQPSLPETKHGTPQNEILDPAAMEAEARRMIEEGTMPSIEQLEVALERIRKEFAPKILEAREKDRMEKLDSTSAPAELEQPDMSDATRGLQTCPKATKAEITGQPTRRAGATYLGPAKPDDPVYSEGWTITLGGFRGRTTTSSGSMPEGKPDNQKQDQQRNRS